MDCPLSGRDWQFFPTKHQTFPPDIDFVNFLKIIFTQNSCNVDYSASTYSSRHQFSYNTGTERYHVRKYSEPTENC